ncbi:RNA polymerase sigma factor, sigma-70 family [Paenibacillaceae bacterium GAS479]|nr:RNA polymerase sigma factor, sigma-70 family [Paenibacillaceae bacterium GAS479]
MPNSEAKRTAQGLFFTGYRGERPSEAVGVHVSGQAPDAREARVGSRASEAGEVRTIDQAPDEGEARAIGQTLKAGEAQVIEQAPEAGDARAVNHTVQILSQPLDSAEDRLAPLAVAAPLWTELAEQACRGDDAAFLRIMTAARPQLLRVSLAYLRNEEAALEAIQETTCRAYAKLGKLRQPELFRTWLIRILINVCADEHKRLRRQRSTDRFADRPAAAKSLSARVELEEAVAELEPKLRQLVLLKYAEDMTLAEIALAMEKPEGTVKTWLSRALKQLRQRMGREEN